MANRKTKEEQKRNNNIPREVGANDESMITVVTPKKPEGTGEQPKSDFDRVLEAIKASEEAMKKSMETSFGVCTTRLNRHRDNIDDHERRIRALEDMVNGDKPEPKPAPVKESVPAKEPEPKPAPTKGSAPAKGPEPKFEPKMSLPGASVPIERRVIEPEEVHLIPGCPLGARYEAAYWVCYVQHIVNGENVERSFIMKDKTSAIQKHNAASKRPHRVYVWLDENGEYLGKLNADALLYLHGATGA